MGSSISKSAVLAQFDIETFRQVTIPILGLRIDFTNFSLAMCASALVAMAFLTLTVRPKALVPEKIQVCGELFYGFIASMLHKVGRTENDSLLAFILAVFTFTISCNLMGIIPGSFTVTSHVAVTFFLSAFIITLVTIVGLCKQGRNFLHVFLPKGVPLWLAPLIAVVEFTAYIFRSVSLSLRLTANMIAGHIMLKVIALLGTQLAGSAFIVMPLIFLSVLTGFEIFVAILQSYVFSILSCVYLSDAFQQH